MDTLNISDLPEDKVSYLTQLIKEWRDEADQETDENDSSKGVVFTPHNSRIIGPITRDEIYDHL